MLNDRVLGSRIDVQPTGAAVARGLDLARARRPRTDRRHDGDRRRLEARDDRRLLACRAPGARALHERLGEPRRRRGSPLGGPLAGLALRILFVADVFGAPGRRAIETRLPSLREELGVDFCIVNGENIAAGRGITGKLADKLLASGADVVTLGNWTWGQQGFAPYLSGTDRVAAAGEPLAAHARRRPGGARRRRRDQPARRSSRSIRSRARSRPPTGSSRKRAAEHR